MNETNTLVEMSGDDYNDIKQTSGKDECHGDGKDKPFPIQFPKFNPSILPEGLTISTMTITGKFDTIFNIENIITYLEMDHRGIVGIKFNDIEKSIIPKKRKRKSTVARKKKKKQSFFNQASIICKLPGESKTINIKLFSNGAVQMTGNRSVSDCNKAISILCRELTKVKAVYSSKEKRVIDKPFVTNPENLTPEKAYKFNIAMINSNINIGFKIDRDKLYTVLSRMGANCIYDPVKHASVDMKYSHKGLKDISIFVFEKGCVMITGASKCKHILNAYSFIIEVIYNNYKYIRSIDTVTRTPVIDALNKDNTIRVGDLCIEI